MGLQQEFLAETAKFILTDDHIKKIIQHDGTNVDFWTGLSYDVASKLRDSHVIGLLSNPNHLHTQKVTHIYLDECNGITDNSLIFIVDHFPQLEVLYAYNCNNSALPNDFGDKLKHLQELNLRNNNITTPPPQSIDNLASTGTDF